jgi:predicted PurR-regulated permease PerM
MARSDLLSSHGRFNHRGIPTGLEPLPIPTLVRILLILAIAALTLAFVVAFVELLALMAGALLILAGAVFLAYAIAPIVAWLRRRLPGIAAIGITYLALLAILAALFFVIIPPLTAQAQQLISSIPSIAQSTQRAIVESGILARLPAALQNYIAALPAELAKGLTSYGRRSRNGGWEWSPRSCRSLLRSSSFRCSPRI